TTVRLNGALTTITRLLVGDMVTASYRTSDKIAISLSAQTPAANTVSGAITALNLSSGSLQITPLVGAATTVTVNAQTRFTLNGRSSPPTQLAVGYLATVTLGASNTATTVAAQTPPLVTLQATLTSISLAAGTMVLTTPALTTITLRLSNTTAITRNGATVTPDKLVVG